MTTKTHDWTRFTRKIYIQADSATVFEAWTKAAKISQWFIAEAQYTKPDGSVRAADEMIQSGDTYFWRWHDDVQITGKILELLPKQKLRFSFGEKRGDSGEDIIVTITVQQLDGETLLELEQDNIATNDEAKLTWYLSCNMGWSFFMTNLKALLEHGTDLREHDAERAYTTRAISL